MKRPFYDGRFTEWAKEYTKDNDSLTKGDYFNGGVALGVLIGVLLVALIEWILTL